MTYAVFQKAVQAAGFTARECRSDHWQILDGEFIVNVWPYTRHGFRFAPHGARVRNGNLVDAIQAAGGTISAAQKSERQSRNRARKVKERLLKADPHCHYCRKELKRPDARLDHKIPLSRGGTNEDSNLVLACESCDRSKGDAMPAEFAATGVDAPDGEPIQEFAINEIVYYEDGGLGLISTAMLRDGKWCYYVDYFNRNQAIGEMPCGGNGPVFRDGFPKKVEDPRGRLFLAGYQAAVDLRRATDAVAKAKADLEAIRRSAELIA